MGNPAHTFPPASPVQCLKLAYESRDKRDEFRHILRSILCAECSTDLDEHIHYLNEAISDLQDLVGNAEGQLQEHDA